MIDKSEILALLEDPDIQAAIARAVRFDEVQYYLDQSLEKTWPEVIKIKDQTD